VGDLGTASTPLRPAGAVRFGDEYVDVVTEGGFIEEGAEVRIVKISANRVVVRET
jgi:membrane-bound serine protease (ClpP class)